MAAVVLTVSLGTWLRADADPSAPAASTGAAGLGTLGSTGRTVGPVPVVLDLRTGGTTPLAESLAGGTGFAASGDGTQLAYVDTGEEGTQQIFIASIDGSEVRQVTHDPTGATSPAWSPDGTSIAYLGHEHYLAVLDLATGESTGILRVRESGFQFTPDGSSLLFTGGTANMPELRTVPVTGGKSTLLFRLSDGLNDSGNGSLSPDGSLVIFIGSGTASPDDRSHCGPCRFVANADGTERQVIPNCYWDPAGAWSPDGGRIVCAEGSNRIIVVDVATGEASTVAGASGAIWLDRHTLLVEGSTSPPSSGDGTIEPPPIPRRSRVVDGVRFSFQVPTEAWGNGPLESSPDGEFRTGRLLITQSIMGPQGAEAVIFWTSFPDGNRAHPCDNLLSLSVGPTTADLANAVATAHGTELVEGPSNVTVGRRPAKHVVLTVRRDLGCDPGFFYTWRQGELVGEMWPGSNVGDTIRVWIVDVNGKRLFFEAETTTQADSDLEKEVERIIRSIRFNPSG